MSTNTKNTSIHGDIHDSKRDERELRGDQGTLDLPEVKDIPGQENFKPAPVGSLGGETFSSADEEGDDLLGDDLELGGKNNVSGTERKVLSKTFDPSYDVDEPINALALDNKDDDGDLLKEKGLDRDLFGDDLDDELVEEEDEETTGEGPDND